MNVEIVWFWCVCGVVVVLAGAGVVVDGAAVEGGVAASVFGPLAVMGLTSCTL
jgi:hypothetical protein